MGSGGETSAAFESSDEFEASISELKKRHKMDLEKLTLTSRPFKTSQLFVYATLQCLQQSLLFFFSRSIWLMTLILLVAAFCFLMFSVGGPHEKHIEELGHYTRFVLWWVALGVASSIGLGSGLHTFVLYLGPHIAFFTIKAMKCGRVDLKTAPYDTIQLNSGPSWLDKDCSEFGPPLFAPVPGSLVKIPVSSVLPQVQLEAILWGLGTALGELPPYFISRAARLSGSKIEAMDGLDTTSSKEDGIISSSLKKIKRWFISHSQHLSFRTILILASVPNPLFDLAGIMCGQFDVPFWKFFFATLIGKALIKTHIQTFFIIALCNNQLLEWVENELIWALGLIPGFSSKLPDLIAKLRKVQEKYLSGPAPVTTTLSDGMAKRWNLSFGLIWNTVIWLMLVNFFAKIVTATAQRYLKKQQELELQLASKLKQKSST